jgi:hypothetical protein
VTALHEASLSGDLNTLITTLEEYNTHLSCIPLPPPQQCDASQAVKDIMRERVVLNGVRFLGQGSLFLETLRRLASFLCSDSTVNGTAGDTQVGGWSEATAEQHTATTITNNPFLSWTIFSALASLAPLRSSPPQGNFVVDSILTRCARTTSGFDSYNTVLQLLPSPEMLLKPRPGQNPPIDIELFVSNGSVQGAVSTTNMYGLYRFEDIEIMGNRMSDSNGNSENTSEKNDDLAWLSIDTVVVEKIDFRTGRSLRFLRIEVPERMSSTENRSSLYRDESIS